MGLKIYNTLTKTKEDFKSIRNGEVKMYVCGPTVYDFLHVGNFRGAIFFNLVRNWLEKLGNKVMYVYNYTDVDDKIIDRANKEGVTPQEIAEKYIKEFERDFNTLGLRKANVNPKVTDFIQQIILIVEKLIENKKAYVVDGEVFYSVDSFTDYGKLSGKNLEDLQVGIRVEVNSKKRNPLDFSLWKPAKPGEPKWSSPWSEGRPGWHIECSAMCSSILGEQIDIHGGGIDLIHPHHENEIAQSEGATGKKYVNYWMHNNFINMSGQKMSKSLGNILTGRKFMEMYNSEIFKYMILMSHYRTQNDFSDVVIEHAISGLARVYSSLSLANSVLMDETVKPDAMDPKFMATIINAEKGIEEALNDDFNTPEVFARIFEVIRAFNASFKRGQKVTPTIAANAKAFNEFIREHGKLMSLYQQDSNGFLTVLDDMLLKQKGLIRENVNQLVEQRLSARNNKDYAKSDELRDQLNQMGIAVQDTPQGSYWEVQK